MLDEVDAPLDDANVGRFCDIVREMSDVQRTQVDGRGIDYELADELDVDTPERLKALGDPLRNTIVDIVLERAMSVTELAERLGRAKGTVAYHVDVLVDAGLIQVVRTRRVRAVEERFYGRVARTYVLPHIPGEIPFLRDVIAEADVERATTDDGTPATMTYRHARIPAERAAEFTERLTELALEFVAEPRGGDTEYGMLLALFPTNRRLTQDGVTT